MSEPAKMESQKPLPPNQSVVSREEKVEFRDEDGNLLDPGKVKELEGKVSFKTRYETRTRMIDAQGNEIEPPEEDAGVAPPHPDVEGPDSSTDSVPEPKRKRSPASQKDVKADESKEKTVERSNDSAPKPASENLEATK